MQRLGINPLRVERWKGQDDGERWHATSGAAVAVIVVRRLIGCRIGSTAHLMERRVHALKSRKRMGARENRAKKQPISEAKRLKPPPPRDAAEPRDLV